MLEKVSSPKFQLDSDTEEHFTEFKIDHLKQRIFYPTLYSIQVKFIDIVLSRVCEVLRFGPTFYPPP